MDAAGSDWCLIAGFLISSVERSGFIATERIL
jgi:hypothetical protein